MGSGIEFYVKYNDKGDKLLFRHCPCCSSVLNLKEDIQNSLGLKPEFMKLSLNGKIFDNDNNNLKFYGVKENSIINLEIKI